MAVQTFLGRFYLADIAIGVFVVSSAVAALVLWAFLMSEVFRND